MLKDLQARGLAFSSLTEQMDTTTPHDLKVLSPSGTDKTCQIRPSNHTHANQKASHHLRRTPGDDIICELDGNDVIRGYADKDCIEEGKAMIGLMVTRGTVARAVIGYMADMATNPVRRCRPRSALRWS